MLDGDKIDLDQEFDPDKHDQQMAALYGDEYYEDEDDSVIYIQKRERGG